jgi:Arylsulfotransferase (ASST)
LRRILGGLALGALLAMALFYGFFAHRQHWFPYRQLKAVYRILQPEDLTRRWNQPAAGAPGLAQRDAVGALMQIPYLSGYNPAAGEKGVTVYDASRAFPGWNLCVSAHAPEARLMDMRGVERHRWAFDAKRAWPNLDADPENRGYEKFWRRALLLPGGDLLVVWEYIGIARIDSGSHLKWASLNGAHHDVSVDRAGLIYVLTREKKIVPELNRDDSVIEDFVTILSPDGRLVKRISLLRSFEHSDYAPDLVPMKSEGDLLHANTVQVLDGSLAAASPHFREGNILVSIHALGIVAILDPAQETIVWALSGQWRAQHRPQLLSTGRILMFDNFGSMRVGQSRALEVDAFTQQIVWRYGEAQGEGFYSMSGGFLQRLPNGNTLIVSSNEGRAIEVTPGKEIVWEYRNPFRAGKKNELTATLEQLERLPADLPVAEWAGTGRGR